MAPASSFGLQIAYAIRNQPAELLGLDPEGLHLRLGVAALEGDHLLDVLGAGELVPKVT